MNSGRNSHPSSKGSGSRLLLLCRRGAVPPLSKQFVPDPQQGPLCLAVFPRVDVVVARSIP